MLTCKMAVHQFTRSEISRRLIDFILIHNPPSSIALKTTHSVSPFSIWFISRINSKFSSTVAATIFTICCRWLNEANKFNALTSNMIDLTLFKDDTAIMRLNLFYSLESWIWQVQATFIKWCQLYIPFDSNLVDSELRLQRNWTFDRPGLFYAPL